MNTVKDARLDDFTILKTQMKCENHEICQYLMISCTDQGARRMTKLICIGYVANLFA
jgi:hypothetical protein